MLSMLVKRRPFKDFFIFGNKKNSHGAISGEYGGWGMTTVLYLAKIIRKSIVEMQQFWNEFCCHSFHTQNISKNVMR
jgi:hypothetical protein